MFKGTKYEKHFIALKAFLNPEKRSNEYTEAFKEAVKLYRPNELELPEPDQQMAEFICQLEASLRYEMAKRENGELKRLIHNIVILVPEAAMIAARREIAAMTLEKMSEGSKFFESWESKKSNLASPKTKKRVVDFSDQDPRANIRNDLRAMQGTAPPSPMRFVAIILRVILGILTVGISELIIRGVNYFFKNKNNNTQPKSLDDVQPKSINKVQPKPIMGKVQPKSKSIGHDKPKTIDDVGSRPEDKDDDSQYFSGSSYSFVAKDSQEKIKIAKTVTKYEVEEFMDSDNKAAPEVSPQPADYFKQTTDKLYEFCALLRDPVRMKRPNFFQGKQMPEDKSNLPRYIEETIRLVKKRQQEELSKDMISDLTPKEWTAFLVLLIEEKTGIKNGAVEPLEDDRYRLKIVLEKIAEKIPDEMKHIEGELNEGLEFEKINKVSSEPKPGRGQ